MLLEIAANIIRFCNQRQGSSYWLHLHDILFSPVSSEYCECHKLYWWGIQNIVPVRSPKYCPNLYWWGLRNIVASHVGGGHHNIVKSCTAETSEFCGNPCCRGLQNIVVSWSCAWGVSGTDFGETGYWPESPPRGVCLRHSVESHNGDVSCDITTVHSVIICNDF